jgi:hypothetical protein
MTLSLHSVFSKLAALSIALALGLAIYQIVVTPLAAYYAEASERIAEQRTLLGRLLASSTGDAREAQDALSAGAAQPNSIFLAGETDAMRIAGLQARLGDAVQAVGARLSTTQAAPARDEAGARLVGVQAALHADIKQLRDILVQLEAREPRLIVDQLQILRGTESAPGAEDRLDIRLVVMGATTRKKS